MDGSNSLLRVAVIQYQSVLDVGSTTANLDRMAELVRKASVAGAQIIVFPELGTSGYGISTDAVKDAVGCEEQVLQVYFA
jgi:predicted amidohydrolase